MRSLVWRTGRPPTRHFDVPAACTDRGLAFVQSSDADGGSTFRITSFTTNLHVCVEDVRPLIAFARNIDARP